MIPMSNKYYRENNCSKISRTLKIIENGLSEKMFRYAATNKRY